MRKTRTHAQRLAAIRELIRTREIATQDELRRLLAREGHEVTQGTLSRDLARLRARRVARSEGGTAYELADATIADSPNALASLREVVVRVTETGALVVVHTLPGMASAVALGIDKARLPPVVGTIAGDDTVFIAIGKSRDSRSLTRQLDTLWKKGGSR